MTIKIEWRKKPLKCRVIRQRREDVVDVILRYSCHLCDNYEREGGDHDKLLRKVRRHVKNGHKGFKAQNTERIGWPAIHHGSRFVEEPARNVQRRWACHACPSYFATRNEFLEHLIPLQDPKGKYQSRSSKKVLWLTTMSTLSSTSKDTYWTWHPFFCCLQLIRQKLILLVALCYFQLLFMHRWSQRKTR